MKIQSISVATADQHMSGALVSFYEDNVSREHNSVTLEPEGYRGTSSALEVVIDLEALPPGSRFIRVKLSTDEAQ